MGSLKPVLPTSFSALSSFETCPRRHYLTRVSQEVPDPPGEAARWGSTVHEALEHYLADGVALPEYLRRYQNLADKIKNQFKDANLLVEQQLAVTYDLEPCDWHSPSAWFRGIVDVAVVRGENAWAFDWKTGKMKPGHDQLSLFAALLFAHFPEVMNVATAYVWLQPKKVTSSRFTRRGIGHVWAELAPRVERLEQAMHHQVWPARPSGLCRSWCPVGQRLCEHCGT